jgi:dynein heavy chain
MMLPDYAMIAEICLYSYGFRQARVLSQKITNSLRLASEQLSTQVHYDYGMRAVSTIIKAAGWLKQHRTDDSEDKIVLKAIKTSNIPKFFNQDLPLFDGIVKDLFPEVSQDLQQDPIEELISFAIIDCKLVENKKFFEKVIQVYSTILIRHGLMIIGQSMAGKSTALNVLSKALSYQNPTSTIHINPKSITLAELYGAPDPISLDWKDGILAQSIRSFSDSNSAGFKWIVLDGPVDALWIESMNTVMDDNKKLCLPNGEIIKLTELIRIIIEVDSLANASPATISRCGMIFIDSEDVLGPNVLISQWCSYPPLDFLAPRYKKLFHELYESIFLPCLEHWALDNQEWSKSHMTRNMITLFECLIISKGKSRKHHDHDISEENFSRNSLKPDNSDENSESGKGNLIEKIISKNALQQEIKAILQPGETEKEKEKLTNFFVFSVFWTLGGSSVEVKRKMLAEFLKKLTEEVLGC